MRNQLKKLIQSIGGEAKLKSIMHDFYVQMEQDILIGFFFTGKDLVHISAMQASFIMNAAGLTSSFPGKGPATAHIALPPILSGHFDRRLVLLREVLIDHQLTDEQIQTWIDFEESFRSMVVT
jgi:truncated hemoglobin YjbI